MVYSDIISLRYKRDLIKRTFDGMDKGRILITEEALEDLKNRCDEFNSMCESFVKDAKGTQMESISQDLANECAYFRNGMKSIVSNFNELNEYGYGFKNPFDTYEDDMPSVEIESDDTEGKISINGIKIWNSNVSGKVKYNGRGVVSTRRFCVGDVIEESPVKILDKSDLYSKTIRDMSFNIGDNGLRGIPFGMVPFYSNSAYSNKRPNADYECYTSEDGNVYIKIYAIDDIRKGDEIILDTDENDFENSIRRDDFFYRVGREPLYSGKYKFI